MFILIDHNSLLIKQKELAYEKTIEKYQNETNIYSKAEISDSLFKENVAPISLKEFIENIKKIAETGLETYQIEIPINQLVKNKALFTQFLFPIIIDPEKKYRNNLIKLFMDQKIDTFSNYSTLRIASLIYDKNKELTAIEATSIINLIIKKLAERVKDTLDKEYSSIQLEITRDLSSTALNKVLKDDKENIPPLVYEQLNFIKESKCKEWYIKLLDFLNKKEIDFDTLKKENSWLFPKHNEFNPKDRSSAEKIKQWNEIINKEDISKKIFDQIDQYCENNNVEFFDFIHKHIENKSESEITDDDIAACRFHIKTERSNDEIINAIRVIYEAINLRKIQQLLANQLSN